ncbi:hypothetical protein ANTQUA_LOCUS2900 [Anthophora quadrimaculata]
MTSYFTDVLRFNIPLFSFAEYYGIVCIQISELNLILKFLLLMGANNQRFSRKRKLKVIFISSEKIEKRRTSSRITAIVSFPVLGGRPYQSKRTSNRPVHTYLHSGSSVDWCALGVWTL